MGIPTNNTPTSIQPMAISDNTGINWVNGFEGAKAALIPLDKPVLLMDSTDSKFYIKQINAQGAPVIQAYRFSPEDASSSVATTTQAASKEPATKEQEVAKKNEDGSTGTHFAIEETDHLAQRIGMSFSTNNYNRWDWYYVLNMVYSDYYGHVPNDMASYVNIAKAFIEDKDAAPGKAYRYYVAMKDPK